ncbi:hypothetical protein JAAARDRAFT_35337 [Jaapia argillacea MUCL 33604]|uniref:Terpene synthase n=1 Tax=Jaapia argillacea MUCL 33604 TaxID=933084 RepID=A0A067Q4X0_9AGAM|nr:hypothetical protein JAAARDRAFT_35337 [Jaapia argillacea MUCL 33604]
MHPNVTHFELPDTLSGWPWLRQLNPHYREVGASSRAWINSFNALDKKAQRAFDLCDFSLLTSLAYPHAEKPHLRACCDMMNLFFVFDEISDEAEGPVVRHLADVIMDALRDPYSPRPTGESVLGEITRQFWERTLRDAKPSMSTQRRFIDSFDAYTTSVAVQAEDRDHAYIRDIDSYLVVRRDTIGTYPSFVMLELGMHIPEQVLHDPTILDLELCITDMICVANDLYSYNVEQARGDDSHNVLTVAMHELDTDLEGALRWVEEYHDHLVARFMDNVQRVPNYGPEVDEQLMNYIDGLGNWARANEAWSFETWRYFGKDGPDIQKHRIVALLPKRGR